MKALSKLILILIVGLALSFALFALVVKPNLGKLSVLGDELFLRQNELGNLSLQVTAFKNAQTDLAKAEKKLKILETFLVRESLVEAVKGMEQAAAKSATLLDTKINEPDPSAKVKEKPVLENQLGTLSEIPYRLTTENDFAGTVKFLQYLENLPQWTEVSRIDLSAETVESAKEQIQTGKVFGAIDGVFFVKGAQP